MLFRSWPIPGYTKVTSPFGKRDSPTAGASSYHYRGDALERVAIFSGHCSNQMHNRCFVCIPAREKQGPGSAGCLYWMGQAYGKVL